MDYKQLTKNVLLMLTLTSLLTACKEEQTRPTDTLPTFSSNNHLLQVSITAKVSDKKIFADKNEYEDINGQQQLKDKPQVNPWIYEVCYYNQPASCRHEYAGFRLQVEPGDTLKIQFKNQLENQLDAVNTTNIHTHGMLVSPNNQRADLATTPCNNAPCGDNIFITTPAGGQTEYSIEIPSNHPAGLYWLHPHLHGQALKQVSAGMAGIITVGNIKDYMDDDGDRVPVRHMLLKDMQVENGNQIRFAQNPGEFCRGNTKQIDGYCTDTIKSWHFSVNGERYPTYSLKQQGEIWRITNASGFASYRLQLQKPDKQLLKFQILSLDGVTVDKPTANKTFSAQYQLKSINLSQTEADVKEFALKHFKYDAQECNNDNKLCATTLLMMPGSRAEIWVANRDTNGKVINNADTIVFKTAGFDTGAKNSHPAASTWTCPAADPATPAPGDCFPEINLAQIKFIKDSSNERLLAPETNKPYDGKPLTFASNELPGKANDCSVVVLSSAKQEIRRVYFGVDNNNFALGYEEKAIFGSAYNNQNIPISFNHEHPISACVPKTNGDNGEIWEIVNLTDEDHNFHIHQTKFQVCTSYTECQDWHDSIPLPASVSTTGSGSNTAT